jgi:circadian clock protein KaiB
MASSTRFQFRLFIAGQSANSAQAVSNLNTLCAQYLPGRHEIEIIDVLKEPARGLEANIILTPTLLKVAPAPARKIIGNLNNTPIILAGLGLE